MTGGFTLDELSDLLTRVRLERAGGRTPPEVGEVHLQLLMARIAALTDTLRTDEANDATRLAARLLLNDLAAVAAQFRARGNEMRSSLAKASADLLEALARGRGPRAE